MSKKCIFCDQTGMSKEHFWPDWMGKELGKSPTDKYVEGVIASEPKSSDYDEKLSERFGNVSTKKFRVVCTKCNNGWMSALEEKVKPIIKNVLYSCDIELNRDQIRLFTQWLVMKTMLAEHSNNNTESTPKTDLLEFGKHQKIPDSFRIYLAKHDLDDNSAYSRTSVRLGTSHTQSREIVEQGNNTQATAFIVGRLFIYVFSCSDPKVNILGDFKLNRLKRVRFNRSKQLPFKHLKAIGASEVNRIVFALENYLNSDKIDKAVVA
ncbi:hypothetical protein [Vibrio sp. CAU 1672]|uniref:hypothetical protein n=1 Tax=Vibrio sp. CAU 1672 TaxID=3032594 RepID=UPI0023DB6FAF|nr:hypothetical protein [Vibrio sp. CAU 1672]MDF2156159.1 hypothetical protein [Vibrio sp. CAU 1672]